MNSRIRPHEILPALLLFACTQDLAITADTTLSGSHRGRDIIIGPGITITVTGDLVLEADRRIVIDGDLRAPDGSGADIRIRSTSGDIEINGEIVSGSGRDGDARTGNGQVIVTDLAGDGGDIDIVSQAGTVIIRGEITAGNGGNGGSATAEGGDATQRAESGGGGNGGQVTIAAAGDIDLGLGGQGSVRAGDGGNSGESSATIMREENSDLPLQGQAFATSASGGRGGDVRLSITTASGTLLVQGDVRAGDGGETMLAMATGGEAEAVTRGAGRGGDIRYTVSSEGQLQIVLVDPSPGNGGNNGVPAGPNHAFAISTTRALARVGAGGDPGLALRGTTELDVGTGGSNGNAQVRVGANVTSSSGRLTLDRTAAPEHEVRRP